MKILSKYMHIWFIVSILLSSCGNDFLTQLPETVVPAESFYKTETDFEQAITGVYVPLRTLYGVGAANYGAWMLGEMRSDNTTFSYNTENRGYSDRENTALFIDNSTTGGVSLKYENDFIIIGRANQVLKYIDAADFDETAKNNYKGQALFLRAFAYFDLVQYFGGVPLVTIPPTSYDETLTPRSSAEQIYEQIIADATLAASLLPHVSQQKKGYVSQGSAYTLLGNVYIVQKNWTEAERVLKLVTGYSLLDDYTAVFDPKNKNHAESIFEVQYYDDQKSGVASDFAYNFLPILSNPGLIPGFPDGSTNNYAGWNTPTPDIIAAYEPGDLRKDASIGYFSGDIYNYVNHPYVKKYVHGAVKAQNTDDDWPVYRYAEVLLFIAEALNEQSGKSGEALTYLNMVHAHPRTGLSAITTSDQSQLRDLIQQERRIELAFENKRWPDLVRTGKALTVMDAFGKRVKANPQAYYYPAGVSPDPATYDITEHRLLFPIPQREIRINPAIEQNSDY